MKSTREAVRAGQRVPLRGISAYRPEEYVLASLQFSALYYDLI